MVHRIVATSLIINVLLFCTPVLAKRTKHKPTKITKSKNIKSQTVDPEYAIQAEVSPKQDEHSYQVRVLLAQMEGQEVEWTIGAEHGVIFTESLTSQKKVQSPETHHAIHFKDGFFYINKKRLRQTPFIIKPQSGHLTFQGHAFHGHFMLVVHDNCGMLINTVDLEDYVCSVLKTEGFPGWPHEMYKVLAITSRSYVMAMIKEAHEKDRQYHVKNTNKHQTYHGVHEKSELRRAVEDTHGIFLSYDKKPILAMFDICCGGIVPAGMEGFDFEKAPYLARNYACTHCKDCKSYSWNLHVEKDELLNFLQKEYPQLTSVRDIKITKKDKAGLVQQAVVKGARAVCELTGRKLYSFVKGIRSYCFGVQKKGSAIIFKGRGFGHHLGLCQWGARAMVSDGWNHKNILAFYYPRTTLMRLT